MTANTLPRLQPLSLGEMLDRAIRVYRKNFVPFTGLVALVQTPMVVLQVIGSLLVASSFPAYPFQPGQTPPPDLSQLFGPTYFIGIGLSVLVSLISFFSIAIMYGVIIRGTSDSYIANEPVTLTGTFRKAAKSFGRLFLTMLLTLLIGLVLFVWFIIPCIGWVSGPGLFIYGSSVIFPFILICCVLEGQGPRGAYRRAWDLARRRFWWTFGFAFLVFVFGFAVTAGPSFLVGIALGVVMQMDVFSNDPMLASVLNTIVQSVVGLATTILLYPIQAISYTLMYFDLRVRTEGFDMAVASADTGLGGAAPADIVAQAPLPLRGNFVTAKEVGYFCLIGVIVIIPMVLLYGVLFAVMMAAFSTMRGGF